MADIPLPGALQEIQTCPPQDDSKLNLLRHVHGINWPPSNLVLQAIGIEDGTQIGRRQLAVLGCVFADVLMNVAPRLFHRARLEND